MNVNLISYSYMNISEKIDREDPFYCLEHIMYIQQKFKILIFILITPFGCSIFSYKIILKDILMTLFS